MPKLLPFGKDSIGPVENFCDCAEGRVVHWGYSRRVTKEPRSLEKRNDVVSLSVNQPINLPVGPSDSRSVRESPVGK